MRLILLPALCLAFALPAMAQEHDHAAMGHDMPSEDEAQEPDFPCLPGIRIYRPTSGSGTSRLPGHEVAMPGHHIMSGDWMLMAHGSVSTQYTDHSRPRGDDKAYVTSMAMLMAERDTSFGRAMRGGCHWGRSNWRWAVHWRPMPSPQCLTPITARTRWATRCSPG